MEFSIKTPKDVLWQESQIKTPKDILCWESSISIDTWATILSYLKEIHINECLTQKENNSVNPDQLIAIMKMSFVNKTLRNLISSNTFWILYNSIEYGTVKYNIYDCNEKFCKILYKIKKLQTVKNMMKGDYNYYRPNMLMIRLINNQDFYRFDILEKENPYPHSEYIRSATYEICYKLTENDHYILFKAYDYVEDGHAFYMKKSPSISYNNALQEFADFCDYCLTLIGFIDLEIMNQFKYFQHRNDIIYSSNVRIIIFNNYLLFTETIKDTKCKIKFYAQNVMTNVKYLIHQMEEETIDGSNSKIECYFANT